MAQCCKRFELFEASVLRILLFTIPRHATGWEYLISVVSDIIILCIAAGWESLIIIVSYILIPCNATGWEYLISVVS